MVHIVPYSRKILLLKSSLEIFMRSIQMATLIMMMVVVLLLTWVSLVLRFTRLSNCNNCVDDGVSKCHYHG